MESAHTLQRSDQKRVNEVKRVRNVLAELERGVIIESAEQMGDNEEFRFKRSLGQSGRKRAMTL